MNPLVVLLIIALVIFAIIGVIATIAKLFERPAQDMPVRWCSACQGMRAFVEGRCISCNCTNAESVRCQIEHCLLGTYDARLLAATHRLEAAQVEALERFYLDTLKAVLRESGTIHNAVGIMGRFSQRMPAPTMPAAPAAARPSAPQFAQENNPAPTPTVVANEFWGQRQPVVHAKPVEPQIVAAPPINLETRDFTRAELLAARAEAAPPVQAPLVQPLPIIPPPPAEPPVPVAERLTRLLLGLGVSGLAIAALVILTAHDGSYSPLKMLGFAGATTGIFCGGVAFSLWLKLERTAGAFYALAALFLPLNALAGHVFGVWPIDDTVAHWGLVSLACSCVYAACAGVLRSRLFALLSGIAFVAGAGFSLEALVLRDVLVPWLRDGLFAAISLGMGVACALVMRQKFGHWTLAIPGGETLQALLAGRVLGEEGRETAAAKPLEAWQLLGMPLRLCADGAALASGIWLILNVAFEGKPALPGFGAGAAALAAYVTLLALGRGWPRLMYATAGLFVAASLAWVAYFGRGGQSLAPVLLVIAGALYAGELLFGRFKRTEFGLPLFHAALGLGLIGLLLVGAELPRLEFWRRQFSLQAISVSATSIAAGGALAALMFGWWSRREGWEWATVPALLALSACVLLGADKLGVPIQAVLTALVLVGAIAQFAAILARKRPVLADWLGWQAFGYGVVGACLHAGLHAAIVANQEQIVWMAPSVLGGVALALATARDRKFADVAGFAGFLIPAGVLAALRTLEANGGFAPGWMFVWFVVAGGALAALDYAYARFSAREFAVAARSVAIGGAGLAGLGSALALGVLIFQQLKPENPAALNLALLGGGALAIWQALRWKQPWMLIAADVLLVPLCMSLVFQAGGDWRLQGVVLGGMACVHGAILLAPLGQLWRATLLGLGATLAGAAALYSLGQLGLETHLLPVPALALSAAFFALASVRKSHIALSLAATACGGLALHGLLRLGVSLDGLEVAAALGFAGALGGCWMLHASGEDRGERLAHWAWALRVLGEVTCAAAGLVAMGVAVEARFAPDALVSPALGALVSALGLALGTALAIARGEESWRAGQGLLALGFASLGAAMGLSALGVEPHWLGLCLVPIAFAALCGGMALSRREEPAHGITLTLGGLAVMAAACAQALIGNQGGDVSRGLTLGTASASLFAVRWLFGERHFTYGGAALLAASAAFWLHFAGLNYAGICAGESALALAFVGVGLWRTREITESALAMCGLALSVLVVLALGARGAECIAGDFLPWTTLAAFILAALHLFAARRAKLSFLDFAAAPALAFGAFCAMRHGDFGATAILLGEAIVACGLVGAGLWRTRNLAESPLALSGLGLSALVTVGLPAFERGFLREPQIALTLGLGLLLAALHGALIARTRVSQFAGLMLLYVALAWCVAMHWAGFSAPEVYLFGPALCLAGLGAFEAKVRDVLWPREFTPNVKMALGMALFFVPLMAHTLDLNHGWEVAMVFVSAAIVCISGVVLKLRVPLRGGIAAATFALVISLVMVIPFSQMGFGWWIGIASTLLILTGIALEKRINGWLRSNVKQVRDRFAAAFSGWK